MSLSCGKKTCFYQYDINTTSMFNKFAYLLKKIKLMHQKKVFVSAGTIQNYPESIMWSIDSQNVPYTNLSRIWNIAKCTDKTKVCEG